MLLAGRCGLSKKIGRVPVDAGLWRRRREQNALFVDMALVLAGATCSNSHDLQLWRGMIVVLAYLFGSQCAMPRLAPTAKQLLFPLLGQLFYMVLRGFTF